jgi:hypothetical protein
MTSFFAAAKVSGAVSFSRSWPGASGLRHLGLQGRDFRRGELLAIAGFLCVPEFGEAEAPSGPDEDGPPADRVLAGERCPEDVARGALVAALSGVRLHGGVAAVGGGLEEASDGEAREQRQARHGAGRRRAKSLAMSIKSSTLRSRSAEEAARTVEAAWRT